MGLISRASSRTYRFLSQNFRCNLFHKMGNSTSHNFNTNYQQNLLVTCFFSRHEQKLLKPVIERRQQLLEQLDTTEKISKGLFLLFLSPLIMNTRLGAISKIAQRKALKQQMKAQKSQKSQKISGQLAAGEKVKDPKYFNNLQKSIFVILAMAAYGLPKAIFLQKNDIEFKDDKFADGSGFQAFAKSEKE